jgi:predicted ferric reductase
VLGGLPAESHSRYPWLVCRFFAYRKNPRYCRDYAVFDQSHPLNPRAYIAHHQIGGIALILLLFHPIFLSLRYFEHEVLSTLHDAAVYLLPRSLAFTVPPNPEQIQNMAINDGFIAMLGMVILLVLTFFVKLPYQIWLLTHKFLGVAFFFAGLHILLINSDVSRDPFLRYYLLTFVALGLIAFVYRTLLGSILIRKFSYHVDAVNVVGQNVIELVMRPVGVRMDYQPGQFVFIRFLYSGDSSITTEPHPFSISSSPSDDFLRLSVKALGDFSQSLMNLKPGAIAEIEGAYGKFSYQNYANQNQIWIAGGIGITPFLSMARSLSATGPHVDLYYSVKSATEFVDFDALSQIVPLRAQQFRVIPFVADDKGFLTADYIEKQSEGLAGKDIFICGPPGMMKAMRTQLRAKGIPNRMIHSEEFAMQ